MLHIKNMVCERCKTAVRHLLEEQGLHPEQIELGEVTLQEKTLGKEATEKLKTGLQQLGFELIDNRAGRLIEKIKNTIIRQIHYSEVPPYKNFSHIISEALHYDYPYLSKLFSETEGITIEQYIILQKIERVKELIAYDELSLTQIADALHYSSVAHLSAQFKKTTGMTPTQFKNLRERKRNTLDAV